MAKGKFFSILLVAALVLSLGTALMPQGQVLAQPPEYWAKTYGGNSTEIAFSIRETQDGGYIVAGYTESFGAGDIDSWVLKLDSGGNVECQKTYGGSNDDEAFSIQETQEGGYIVAGYTESFGAGDPDFWVLKLDSRGNVTWQKTYGGSKDDVAYSIHENQDGGYIVAGYTDSFGAGYTDFWVLKLDSGGNVTWQDTYGGSLNETAFSIQQTQEGGYIVAGYTTSFGAGYHDFWVLKLDSGGNVTWQKTYGGSNDDEAFSIQETQEGGYIVAGYTESFGAGLADFWVLKLDSSGNVTWQKTYGGSEMDWAYSIQQTQEGGYIVAGTTGLFPAWRADYWVFKLDSGGNVQWEKTYSGNKGDVALSIQETQDGGYIVAGGTNSSGAGYADFWLLRLDSGGLIGPECPLGVDSRATVTETTVTGEDTCIAGVNSTAEIDSPTITVEDTDCTIETQCYYSPPAPSPPPPAVPMVSEWGALAMMAALAGFMVWTLRRKRVS